MNAAEPIDGSTATPAELRRAGIAALVKALARSGTGSGSRHLRFESRRISCVRCVRRPASAST
jgi:hypothetical protein